MKMHLHSDHYGTACNVGNMATNNTHQVTCKNCKKIIQDYEKAGYVRSWGSWERNGKLLMGGS